MADQLVIDAQKRSVIGKQVKALRRDGFIPGVLYGPNFDPLHLQVPWAELRPTLLAAGGSKIIQLNLEGEEYNALVRDVQRAPMRGDVLHVDFYRVRMDVEITTDVPVTMFGDTTVIDEAGGVVVQEMTTITVQCLPGDLPSEIRIDASVLQEVGDSLLVADLPEFAGVTLLANEDDVVISSTYPQRPVEEEEEVEEELDEFAAEGEEPELIRPEREDKESEE